jgi:hypothetical protein
MQRGAMDVSPVGATERDPYFHTSDDLEAVTALEATSYLLKQYPAMMKTGRRINNFLLNESDNIIWSHGPDREGLKPRSDEALARIDAAVVQIDATYAELADPASPLCGSPSKKKR